MTVQDQRIIVRTPTDEAIASPSYSSLSSFQKCPQQWHYDKVLRLARPEDDDPQPALELGTWWHALRAADSLDRGRSLGSLRVAPKSIKTPRGDDVDADGPDRVGAVLHAIDQWWASESQDVRDVWLEAIKEDVPARILDMWARFRSRFAAEREDERPLAVEMGWGRDLAARSDVRESRDVRFKGYVDEIVQDVRRGLVIVRDHKTGKSFPYTSRDADAAFATAQLSLYAWACTPLISAWGVGPINAVEYDRARTAKPTEPKVTKTGALSKTVTQYDLETYLRWVSDRASDPTVAFHTTPDPKIVEELSSPAKRNLWFVRETIPLNMRVVRTHLRDMQRTVMAQQYESDLAVILGEPRLRRASGSAACTYCDFAALCSAETRGGAIDDLTPEVLENYRLRRRDS